MRLPLVLVVLLPAGPVGATELRQREILIGVAGAVVVEIGPWLGHFIERRARLRGIEVPNLNGVDCEAEPSRAEAAVAVLRGPYGFRVGLRAAARPGRARDCPCAEDHHPGMPMSQMASGTGATARTTVRR